MRCECEVRDLVRIVGDALNRSFIHSILYQEGSKRRARHNRLSYDHMSPPQRHAVRSDPNLDPVRKHGTIVAALHVIFAGPDEFYGNTFATFGDGSRFALHMRIRRRSSPESAAGHLGVKGNLLRLQAEDFGNSHLIDGLKLRTGPNFSVIAIKPDGSVQWLH